jgi:hypothetical protein
LAGALLFDEKIRQSAALFWFGLLEFFHFRLSLIFGDSFGGNDCGLCPCKNQSAKEVGGLEVFLYEVAQNFELFSHIQDQN